MAEWSWSIGPGASSPDSRPLRELTQAYGRTATWRTKGHAVAQFSIDGRSDEAAEIVPRVTDLWAWRDGTLMFRGRINTPGHRINADRHAVQFTAIDYRGMLGTRTLWDDPPTFSQVDQADIAWALVEATQQRTGGDWGVTRGLAPSGQPRDRTSYPPMKNLLAALNELSEVQNGFEWEISPSLVLNIWSPRRGEVRQVGLDYGGMLADVDTTDDASKFGNAAGVTGDENTVPATAEADGLASDPRGRWETVRSHPSVSDQTTLDERAPAVLDAALVLSSPMQVTFAPEMPRPGEAPTGRSRWTGPEMLWLGDVTPVRIHSGALGTSIQRVMEMQISPGDHGTETVRAGLVTEIPDEPEDDD